MSCQGFRAQNRAGLFDLRCRTDKTRKNAAYCCIFSARRRIRTAQEDADRPKVRLLRSKSAESYSLALQNLPFSTSAKRKHGTPSGAFCPQRYNFLSILQSAPKATAPCIFYVGILVCIITRPHHKPYL